MGEIPRLKIPGVRFSDGPRGCIMGNSTDFPVAMARAASWDVSLEERVGRAIGRECKALGANLFGGICVNLPRHPAWGRIQETYGEDPILLGTMGAAMAKGVQENVMGCVKHFALNSMENARFKIDVQVDEDVLHEVYLPQFRYIVESGVASVMSAYNSVRGEFAGQNRELLTDILRTSWGFKGFVIEDFIFGFRDVALSLRNGLDLEAPFRQQRAQHLRACLETGRVSEYDIDRAGHAILRIVIENEVLRGDIKSTKKVVFSKEHRDLARESAVKSMVLLKNDTVEGAPILPIRSEVASVGIVGWRADSKNTGDKGSSHVRCPEIISPYQGIKEALPETEVVLESSNNLASIKSIAAAVEVVVVVVGYDFRDEGEYTAPAFNATPGLSHVIPPDDGSEEAKSVISRLVNPAPKKDDREKDNYGFGTGGDRRSLRLRPDDVEVIKAAVEVNRRTIVTIVAGGTVIIEEWDSLPPAIIFGWYSGCEGGRALAEVLLGRANFSGRLPFSIPTSEEHLPAFDDNEETIKYDRCPYVTTANVGLLPISRDSVWIASSDPNTPPLIKPNFFSSEVDRFVWRDSMRHMTRMMIGDDSPLSQGIVEAETPPAELKPFSLDSSDEDIEARIRASVIGTYHPMEACAMGKVVDSELRVKGVENLRVVDASVFPSIIYEP
ncbi:hypothetical protein CkaCkLH20_06912 [Colletotrichum karsti]|uniref:beta-glucosidase n=1 Tax=Colletotrichum karsti TaxID=1095194 RepID=A0A9P6I5N6_9PEZI|nr:uncharacterized protein CkaCkLH20_06912 [Colletotrichum karsti]KAF9875531.1 hypothetical protein CkaCkLH20_06912 [Colletotrichum karsti]